MPVVYALIDGRVLFVLNYLELPFDIERRPENRRISGTTCAKSTRDSSRIRIISLASLIWTFFFEIAALENV